MTGAGSDAALLMDRIYRHQRGIYDLTRRYYLLGRDRLIETMAPPSQGSVVEIGCGTGRNLIQAARRYPHARFYGLDISREMLATARSAIAGAGFSQRITLAQADATRFGLQDLFGEIRPDRIFISYSLSMIPAWRMVVEQALASLPPEGSLHIVDFGQQEGLPDWFRSLLFRWLAWFEVRPIEDLERDLSDLAGRFGRRLQFERLHRGYAVLARL